MHHYKTEERDAEDNLRIPDWLQSFSELEISEAYINSWFEGIEEKKQCNR